MIQTHFLLLLLYRLLNYQQRMIKLAQIIICQNKQVDVRQMLMVNIIIHSQETEGSHTGGTITTSMALNEALEVLDNEHEQNGNYNTLFRLYN